MLKEYAFIKNGEIAKIYNKLPDSEQKNINDYMEYRKARGLNAQNKLGDIRTNIIHLRNVAQKPLHKLDFKELIELSNIVKSSSYCDCAKNEIIVNLKRYVRWKNPKINTEKLKDDIKLIKDPVSKRIINPKDLLTKEDVEKLIKHETKMFWKAFLIIQYEGGLRTKETRYLRWGDVQLNSDGDISELSIFATKTKKPRPVFVKEATFYLKKLKEEQENLNQIGTYIFHSKKDLNQPVNRSTISEWMSTLSERALGKHKWNYLLRHSKGNELYQLTKQGKISKDIAIAFMGHSENMSKVYTHDESDKIKKMLKDQIYHLEDLPPEKKIEFEEKIDDLEKNIHGLENRNKNFAEELTALRQEIEKRKGKDLRLSKIFKKLDELSKDSKMLKRINHVSGLRGN